MINRKVFFDEIRAHLFSGFMSSAQVTGVSNILDEAERRGEPDPRFLAYRLATTFHETARAMVPVREEGSDAYLRSKPYFPWVGEGLVQVTWEANARKFGATKPGDCMSWPVALRALFDGMDDGTFTGRKLSTYFNAKMDDPVGARHIINGSDKAALIATYHGAFLAGIKAATITLPAIATSPLTPEFNKIATAINTASAAQAAKAVSVPSVTTGPFAGLALPAHEIAMPAKTGLAAWWARHFG